MAEGFPRELVDVTEPVASIEEASTDVSAPDVDGAADGAEGGTSLQSPLPDRAPGRVQMAALGVVHGEIVPVAKLRGEYL